MNATAINHALQLFVADEEVKTTLALLNNPRIKAQVKNTIPFSRRLNEFLISFMQQHWDKFVFTDTDDFDSDDIEGTLARHREIYLREGKIYIWTGASDFTIFGSAKMNHYFRAWHDYIHMVHNLGYDFVGETAVANIQMAQLPLDWAFERALVNSEIIGQWLYYAKYGEFINDQRAFTLDFIDTGTIHSKF